MYNCRQTWGDFKDGRKNDETEVEIVLNTLLKKHNEKETTCFIICFLFSWDKIPQKLFPQGVSYQS